MNDTTLLLVGHGSRGREGNKETINFAAQWRERHPDWRIEVCFIEHAEVLLDEGLDRAARGARQVLVLPFILNAAGHVKMELPHALEEARQRHPGVEFAVTRHLGMGRDIFAVLQGQLERLMKQLAMPDPMSTGVILLGRGSSDAGANGELAKMARWIFEANDHELVDLAFTGVTWPRLENEEFIMTIGSARPMEDAARIAYRELTRWLASDYGFEELEAYFLLTQAGRVRVGNMVDPKYTLGASIKKSYLAQ